MQPIDIIALDLDGTALRPDNSVSEQTRRSIARAREKGVRIVIATGRICAEAREFAERLGADDLMVTSGGAALSSVREGKCTKRFSIEWESAVRAAAVVERIGMAAMIYAGDRLIITPYDNIQFSKYKSNEGYLAARQVEPSVAEYIANERLPIDKIFVRSQDVNLLSRARAQLAQLDGVRVMSSAPDNIEVISPDADKGRALGLLCSEYGTDLSHAAAIGDSENDLEMLRAVALPIAMGNATEQVKALCARITATNAEDGVARAIDQLVCGG